MGKFWVALRAGYLGISTLVLKAFIFILAFSLSGPRFVWLQANEWAWFSGIAGVGFGVASMNEFGLAAIMFSLAALSCSAQLLRWCPANLSSGLSNALKVVGVMAVVLVLVYLLAVENIYRGERAWSQLPQAISKVEILVHPLSMPIRSPNPRPPLNTAARTKDISTSSLTPKFFSKTHLIDRPDAPKPLAPAPSPIQIEAALNDPMNLVISVKNLSSLLAEGVFWQLLIYRERDQTFWSYHGELGYIKAFDQSGFYEMALAGPSKLTDATDEIAEGDVFTGSLAIDCPKCQGLTYIVHISWKQDGWFSPYQAGNGKMLVSRDHSKMGISQSVKALVGFVPIENRKAIMARRP